MKVFKMVGMAAFFLSGSAALQAQNVVSPGELAGPSNVAITRSSFDPGVGASSIVAKSQIANVEDRHQKRTRVIWVASIVAMTAGTAADAASSWHKHESNGLLASSDGTFGAKGAGIKAGLAGGMLLPQIIFRKHHDWRSAFAIGNFAEAGIFTGTAVHNFQVK